MIKNIEQEEFSSQPDPIDVHVGLRVRMYRTLRGLSQEKLARRLGLTFQQVQKYERGLNRISASRLWELSRILDTPIQKFYEDVDESAPKPDPKKDENSLPVNDLNEEFAHLGQNPLTKRETLELVRAFYRVPNRKVAHKIVELINSLSDLADISSEKKGKKK